MPVVVPQIQRPQRREPAHACRQLAIGRRSSTVEQYWQDEDTAVEGRDDLAAYEVDRGVETARSPVVRGQPGRANEHNHHSTVGRRLLDRPGEGLAGPDADVIEKDGIVSANDGTQRVM
jgi:hypothetical protein